MPGGTSAFPPPADKDLPKLAIIAGGGELPAVVIQACREEGRPFFVLALEGQADPERVADAPHFWCRIGAAAEGERILRENGAKEVVFVGKVRRPSLKEMRPDWRALKVMVKATVRALGDDGLLRAVIREFEESGAVVRAPQEIVRGLLAVEGAYGRIKPDRQARIDMARGYTAAKAIGALDVGQAVVVQQGIVIGVEAIEGTDELIARSGALQRDGAKGVLVKVPKPRQERRIDLPAIGAETVESVARAGLRGIAVEAGGALVIDRAKVAARADALGVFVFGMPAGGSPGTA
ncbi:MAG: UDP-2,3-diacylglucosamine diphosphatase LpxI [Rhodospirillaceae bacterium]|nr:UDP-2,3-diacylglucosamine diphosphatase LpxI [Rhodospirillaceae bacterium]